MKDVSWATRACRRLEDETAVYLVGQNAGAIRLDRFRLPVNELRGGLGFGGFALCVSDRRLALFDLRQPGLL